MSWHSLFDTSTIEGRHLLAAYAVVFLLQGGYFAWIVAGWRASRRGKPLR
jgi:hypothetical protein